ncbi:MAG: lipid-A-disaccharide synthase [Thermoanaerobaculia bacterium]|nr:lipid-A-disaccharide synthase [Thermoanaerobaculia bacterium]
MTKLAIIAGEASGDLHAGTVLREIREIEPGIETFGIGGDLLASQGMDLLFHAREMGIVGLFNVLRHLGMFRRVFREVIARIAAERPDAVLLVDYPDFNLRVAKKCKELGLKVIYFISPQVWAWRRGRVKQIARYVDHMIVIFPFEEAFYRSHGVPVTYVGHPLVDQTAMLRRSPSKPDRVRVALMPGSRRREVDDLLPAMLDAIAILQKERTIEAFIIQAPTIDHEHLEEIVKAGGVDVPILPHDRGEALSSADIALSSSGTATLESAVIGTPVVVMYRLGRATFALARRLVKLPHFSLVNIVAERRVVPELLQDAVTGERIAQEVRTVLEPGRYAQIKADLAEVKRRLGDQGASRRAAEAIMAVLAQ